LEVRTLETQPYTQYAGQTMIVGAQKDHQGNALGTNYDLANDGAFDGKKILVLHLYTGEGFDFKEPQIALESKGFSVVRHTSVPALSTFIDELKTSCQLWVISNSTQFLSGEYISEIEDFFHSGKGLFLWGDNDPYHADANAISRRLFSAPISGYFHGDQVVTETKRQGTSGFVQHLITTGLEHLYEGITVSNIDDSRECLHPIMTGSDSDLITAVYDRDGKRAIIDGGFTRLYNKWDEAGTARFVKNAAAWLVNWERFNPQSLHTQGQKHVGRTPAKISPRLSDNRHHKQKKDRAKPGSLASQRRDF
jgi:hypothetical protein